MWGSWKGGERSLAAAAKRLPHEPPEGHDLILIQGSSCFGIHDVVLKEFQTRAGQELGMKVGRAGLKCCEAASYFTSPWSRNRSNQDTGHWLKQQNTRKKESSLHEAFLRNLEVDFGEVDRVNGKSYLNSVSKDDYREVCGEDIRRQWMECVAKIYGHKLWQFVDENIRR